MKLLKHLKITKQAAMAVCITALLLFAGTACGEKAPGEGSSQSESSSDPGEVPSQQEGSSDPAGTPGGSDPAQAPTDNSTPGEDSAASDSSQAPDGNSPSGEGSAASNPGQAPAASGSSSGTGAGQAQITLEDAKNAALANAGLDSSAVTYTKEKLDYEDGIAVYEIEFYTSTHEYEYEIDAATGAVYSMHTEAFDDGHSGHSHHSGGNSSGGSSSGSQDTASDIGMESAKSIALEHAGLSAADVTFKKTQSDIEDGRNVYELEFYKDGREYEYTILAADGTILEYEID